MKHSTHNNKICIECQECCKWLTFTLTPMPHVLEHWKEYYTERGCKVIQRGSQMTVLVPHVCQHLKESGCEIYAGRPKVCFDYDGRQDPFLNEKCDLPEWS